MINHIALKVLDLKKMAKFYTLLLNQDPYQEQHDPEGQLRSVWFDLEGTILMLEISNKLNEKIDESNQSLGWHLLALSISKHDRGKWHKKLEDLNIEVIKETDYSIYFLDPEMNRLTLSHYPEK